MDLANSHGDEAMSHGPEHQIEHAEHAAHAVHDAFNRKVTISIAGIAAFLACVTMLGHRAHNETLQLQNEAGRMATEATDAWNYYQTKNIRSFQAQIMLNQMLIFAVKEGSASDIEKVHKKYQDEVDKYAVKLPQLQKDAETLVEKGKEYAEQSHVAHARADRFDYGELGLQLGVVLCSLAILTRSRSFLYCGLVAALVGCLVALTGLLGLFMGGH
jgi:uncharacterized protein YeeX (DUF496 family)